MRVPRNGWFLSWKVHLSMDDDWGYPQETSRASFSRTHLAAAGSKEGFALLCTPAPTPLRWEDTAVFRCLNLLQPYFPKRSRYCLLPDARYLKNEASETRSV